MSWWLTVFDAGRVHGWQFDTHPTDDQITRARALVAFPPGESWILDETASRRIHLTEADDLHPTLMARLQLHRVETLATVTQATLDAYAAQALTADRDMRMRLMREAMMRLPEAERRAIAAEFTTSTPIGQGGTRG